LSKPAAVPGTPVTASPAQRSRASRLGRGGALVLAVAALALGATFVAWRESRLGTQRELHDYFDYRVRDALVRIEQRMAAYHQVLRGAHGVFSTSPVTRREFARYVAVLRVDRNFPGIQGVGFAVVVAPADLSQHVASVRAEGFPDYRVWPEGARERYTSIIYLEPFAGRNLRAFGYDMYTEAIRREAMDLACDRDDVAISGKVRLVQETDEQPQAGFLMYVPIFNVGPAAPSRTFTDPATRRSAVAGWVYAPFRMNDLMAGILGEQGNDLDLAVYDGDGTASQALMFDNTPEREHRTGDSAITTTRRVDVGGHRWTLVIGSRPSLEARLGPGNARSVLAGGVFISVLLAALTFTLVKGNRTLEARVSERTAELAESEEKYRVVFNNELAAICIFELDSYRFVDVNRAFETMYGWSRDELLAGMTIHDVSAEPEVSVQSSEQADRQGTIFIPLRWHRKKDGTVFPVEIVGGPYLYRGQRVMFAMALDISARLRAEQTAQATSAELAQFFTLNLDLLCIADTGGRFRRLNPEWERTLGYPLRDLEGAAFLDFVHPEDLADTIDAMAGLARQEAVQAFVNRYRSRDGSYRAIEWRAYPAGDLIYAAARDITEQRRLQDELARISREQSVILENANVGITFVQDRVQVWANRNMADLFGYDATEMAGQPTRTFFTSDAAYEQFGREAYPTLAAGRVHQAEIDGRPRKGRRCGPPPGRQHLDLRGHQRAEAGRAGHPGLPPRKGNAASGDPSPREEQHAGGLEHPGSAGPADSRFRPPGRLPRRPGARQGHGAAPRAALQDDRSCQHRLHGLPAGARPRNHGRKRRGGVSRGDAHRCPRYPPRP
jgi:PAS domain S-box-containing protein